MHLFYRTPQSKFVIPGIWVYYWHCIGLSPRCKPIPSLKRTFCHFVGSKALAMVVNHVRPSLSVRKLFLDA